MSDYALSQERRHRLLKEQIKLVKQDQVRLVKEVCELEQKHMDLVQSNVQVDWDLRYTNLNDEEPLEDGESEEFNMPRIDLTEKYKMMAAEGKREGIAKEIVLLELDRRQQTNLFGVVGTEIELKDSRESGPVKFHGLCLRETAGNERP